jgi:predicted O-methyltransferase YrrM
MAEGMDQNSVIISVDNDIKIVEAVRSILGEDQRLTLICEDGHRWIESYFDEPFDLIFADTWPGKYFCLEQTLDLLKPGGFYVIDDMLPQPDWPAGHEKKAAELVDILMGHDRLFTTRLDWSSGVMVCTKKLIP